MIYQNCIFCKMRTNDQEKTKASIKGLGLGVLCIDDKYCLAQIKNKIEPSQLEKLLSKLMNTVLFSSCSFSKSAFVGRA